MSLALYLIMITCLLWILWDKKLVRGCFILVYFLTLFFYKNEYLQYTPVVYSAIYYFKNNCCLQKHVAVRCVISLCCVSIWLYYRLFVNGSWNCMADAIVAFPLVNILYHVLRYIPLIEYIGERSSGIFYIHTLLYTWPLSARIVYLSNFAPVIFVSLMIISILYSECLNYITSTISQFTTKISSSLMKKLP